MSLSHSFLVSRSPSPITHLCRSHGLLTNLWPHIYIHSHCTHSHFGLSVSRPLKSSCSLGLSFSRTLDLSVCRFLDSLDLFFFLSLGLSLSSVSISQISVSWSPAVCRLSVSQICRVSCISESLAIWISRSLSRSVPRSLRLSLTLSRSLGLTVSRSLARRSLGLGLSVFSSLDLEVSSVSRSLDLSISSSLDLSISRSLDLSISRSLGLSVSRFLNIKALIGTRCFKLFAWTTFRLNFHASHSRFSH